MSYSIIAIVIGLLALVEILVMSCYTNANVAVVLSRETPTYSQYLTKTRFKLFSIGSYAVMAGLVLFAGLRYNTGYDYFAYDNMFANSASNSWIELNVEPLYYLFNYFLNILGFSFSGFLLTFALFSVWPKSRLFNNFSPYLFLSLYIFFTGSYIGFDFGVIRQGAAISICLFAWEAANKNDLRKFTLFIILAMGFHQTAIIFFPYYFIRNFNLKYITVFYSVSGSLFGAWILTKISIVQSLALIAPGNPASERIAAYTDSSTALSTFNLTPGAILKIIFILFFIYCSRKKEESNLYSAKTACNAYFISVIGFLLLNQFALIASRLFSYFKFFEVIFLPELVRIQETKTRKLMVGLLIIFAFYYQMERDLGMDYSFVLHPYQVVPAFREFLRSIF